MSRRTNPVYMFRAERQIDALRFLFRLCEAGCNLSQVTWLSTENYTEVMIRVSRDPSYKRPTLNAMLFQAEQIIGCEAIYETLNYAHEYTGERYLEPSEHEPNTEIKSEWKRPCFCGTKTTNVAVQS